MSRREGRDSHGRRLSSRFDREHSPKKPRRDGKPETEKAYASSRHSDIVDAADIDHKPRRRLQDALPLEIPSAPETAVKLDTMKKGLDRKNVGLPEGPKRSSDQAEVRRPRSHFQHDEYGSATQGGRSYSRRDHGRGRDQKEQQSDKVRDNSEVHELQKKEEKIPSHADDKVWRHDRYYELEAEAPPSRKRPAFSEKKTPSEPESTTAQKISETVSLPRRQSVLDATRREERGHRSLGIDQSDQPFSRLHERTSRWEDAPLHRGTVQHPIDQSRERFNSGAMRGRDRMNGRYGESTTFRPGVQVDKWKHDMFEEANKSPNPKNEEEQIARVEALLAL